MRMACCLNSGLEILASFMITFYLNRFSNHAREVRDQFLLLTLLLIPTYTLSLSNHDLNQVSQAVFYTMPYY